MPLCQSIGHSARQCHTLFFPKFYSSAADGERASGHGGHSFEQALAALLFQDQAHLNSLLGSLRHNSAVELACIFTADQKSVLARWEPRHMTCAEVRTPLESGFRNGHYQVAYPILSEGEAVGTLYLSSHLIDLRDSLSRFIWVSLAAVTGSALLLLFITLRLQRRVSGPIAELSVTANRIAEEGDYSLRVAIASEDELGHMAKAFNLMIEKVEDQNRQILESYDQLERTVAERTRDLTTANKELEAFSYSVSHDLRQPLRAIDGFSQAVLEDYAGCMDATGLDYLGRVRAATVRMGRLIDSMLQLSRVTRSSMSLKPVDLTRLVNDVVAQVREQYESDVLQTRISIQPKMTCLGDPNFLHIAFYNVIENAWKYTSRSPMRQISVSAEVLADKIEVSVQDNGVGFDMNYYDKLFNAFNRLHTPSDFQGTGIGLATVYRVVARHHGEIRAESVLGQGAKFIICLPNGQSGD